jgi:hypothetical protein
MQLIIPIQNFNIQNVFFNNPIPNTVLEGSMFVRILYSDDNITFNGIYLGLRWKASLSSFITFNITSIYNNNNYINDDNNESLEQDMKDLINEEKDIQDLILIERNILNKINIKNKNKVYQIQEQIKSIFINLKKKFLHNNNLNNSNISFIFKCSGIWITDDSYGLTFKFIDNSSSTATISTSNHQ